MTAVGNLTEHEPELRNSIGSLPLPRDFDNSDVYMNGFSSAYLFEGNLCRFTPSILYPADPILCDANNNANPGKFVDNLRNDDKDNIKLEDDGEVEPNYHTPVNCFPAKSNSPSPETESKATRQMQKRMMSLKGKYETQPSKAVFENKDPKTRRQPKRESATKVSSVETGTSISRGVEKRSRRTTSLDRNRVAASQCRKRKKQWTDNLETKKSRLEAHNKSLHVQHFGLVEEVSQLKNMLIAHASCNNPNIDVWVENEAMTYVRKLSNPRTEQHGSNLTESVADLQDSQLRQLSSGTQIREESQDTLFPNINMEGELGADEALESDPGTKVR